MAGRFSRGWALVGQSWRVLKVDKELVLFPIFSSVTSLLVMASFVVPLAFNGQFERWFGQAQNAHQHGGRGMPADPLFYVWLFSFYFVSYAAITFFNAALIAAAIERFGGGKPTIGSGLSAAASRLPQILAWALVSATVGMVLKIIEDRGKGVGRFVAGLLGAAWTIATFFVVPVIVVEKAGPIEAIKRSGSIIRKTWGEGLVGNLGLSLVFFALFLLAALPVVAGAAIGIGMQAGPVPVLAGLAISILLWIVLSLISSTLRTILVAAAYEYAATGKVPGQFDQELLQGAFRVKGR
jgi:hypothetical protein